MSKESNPDSAIPVAVMLCPVCHADILPTDSICVRCGSPTKDTSFGQSFSDNPFTAPSAPKDVAEGTSSLLTFATIVLVIGLIGVLIAVGSESPGLAITFGVMMIAPLVRTSLAISKRSKSGMDTSRAATVAMFAGSAAITMLIVFITLISCVVSFCFVCIGVAVATNGQNEAVFLIAALVTVAVCLGLVLLLFRPWLIHRWKRDTEERTSL